MNDPETEAINQRPLYMDLANAIVGLRGWFCLCGAERNGYRISVSEINFCLQKMEERIRRALASGIIRGYFQEGTEFIELPEPLWKNDTAWKAIRAGMQLKIETETTESMFRLLVKLKELTLIAFPHKDQPAAPSADASESGQHPRWPPQPSIESTEPRQALPACPTWSS